MGDILHNNRYPTDVESDDGSLPSRANTDDQIDAILENYQFTCKPELRLKFRTRLKELSLSLCAACCKPWELTPRWRFSVKPHAPGNPLAKAVNKFLVLPHAQTVEVHSAKMSLGVLRLQFCAGYNWERQRPTLDYRITTKWGDGPRMKRKERLVLNEALQLRCRWNLECHFPDVEGHFGRDDAGEGTAYDLDYGSMSFEVQQLDAVIDLFS